jgi:hypothetical protein
MDFARIGPLLAPAESARDSVTRIVTRQPEKLDELDGLAAKATSLASELTGFRGDAITLSPNTSAALFHMAFSLPPGEVLVSPFDFPANVQPWLRAQEHGRARVRWMTDPDGTRLRITPELIASALTAQTTAVAVSVVDSYTGYQIDLDALRSVIGDRLLIVDGIQALGALDIPWQAADVVASGAQKWLRRRSARLLGPGAGTSGRRLDGLDRSAGRERPAVDTATRGPAPGRAAVLDDRTGPDRGGGNGRGAGMPASRGHRPRVPPGTTARAALPRIAGGGRRPPGGT